MDRGDHSHSQAQPKTGYASAEKLYTQAMRTLGSRRFTARLSRHGSVRDSEHRREPLADRTAAGDLGDGVHTGGPEDPRVKLIEVRAKCE